MRDAAKRRIRRPFTDERLRVTGVPGSASERTVGASAVTRTEVEMAACSRTGMRNVVESIA